MSKIETQHNNLVLAFDCHSLIYRSWFALSSSQLLTTANQENVTAVYGFARTYLSIIEEYKPSHCIATFDTPRPTFRHKMRKEYKANRPPAPPELIPQFEKVKEFLAAFDVPRLEFPGYEADDIIGTIISMAESKQKNTLIITSDSDLLQLVSKYTKVLMLNPYSGKKVYGNSEIQKRYSGLLANQLIDLKALQGDKSDNIIGVPGIGEKTAIKLLSEYQSIENIYKNLNKINPIRIKNLLENHETLVKENIDLVTIKNDLNTLPNKKNNPFSPPIFVDYGKFNISNAIEMLKSFEFFSLVQKVSNLSETMTNSQPVIKNKHISNYELIDNNQKLEKLKILLKNTSILSIDTETTNLDPWIAKLVGISISIGEGKAWYVPLGHTNGKQISFKEIQIFLNEILSKNKKIIFHNANFDLSVLRNAKIKVESTIIDTMVAAHILGKTSIGLKQLGLEIFGIEMEPIKTLIGSGKKQISIDNVSIEEVKNYACLDAEITFRLWEFFEKSIELMPFKSLFYDLEMPLVKILVDIEEKGIEIDLNILESMSTGLTKSLTSLQEQIFTIVGEKFNLNSPKQLSDILFTKINLRKTRKIKTGYSTDSASLDSLKKESTGIVAKILEYRHITKIKTTYVDSLPKLRNPNSNRLHTKYNQIGSTTGRISSSEPNLQNIPIKTEIGKKVRNAFIVKDSENFLLMSIDYSQIELRILAHLSKDDNLCKAFNEDEDIHSKTASLMFGVPPKEVTEQMRRVAKILNFGVIFGLSPYGISQQTEFSIEEGAHFIKTYFAAYPKIETYIESTLNKANTEGYVETLFGRRRYIPELTASNRNIRQAGERMAINMPIQGTAADIMKIAMINIDQKMQIECLESQMILQVHDELIFETKKTETSNLTKLAVEAMTQNFELIVPLKTNIKVGSCWGEI